MQVKFPAENKLGEGKAGGFLLRRLLLWKGKIRSWKIIFHTAKFSFSYHYITLPCKMHTLNEKFSTYIRTHTKMHKAVQKYLKKVFQFLKNVQKVLTKMRVGLRAFFLYIKWEQEKYPKNIKKASKIFSPP